MISKKTAAKIIILFLFMSASTAFSMETIKSMDSLRQKASKGKVLVVDFWAQWCAPCKAFDGVFANMEKSYASYGGKIEFVKFDVTDTNVFNDVKKQLNFNTIPTVIVFSGGLDGRDVFSSITGNPVGNQQDEIKAAIDRRLSR